MDAVFRIAETITVMVNGTAIASGAPAAIRANADVRTAYLGEDDRPGHTPGDPACTH
ncbi:leucine/isoleucine/valine transporter ATP-binding subunit [compost metagenome]